MEFRVQSDMRVFQVCRNPDTYEYAPSPMRAIEQAVEHYGNHIMANVMAFGAPVELSTDELEQLYGPTFPTLETNDATQLRARDILDTKIPIGPLVRSLINSNSVNHRTCDFPQQTVFHKGGHTERQWEGKFFRCGMRCYWCLKPLMLLANDIHDKATKGHLTPTSRGGSNLISNIVPECIVCNDRKGTMTEAEFRKTFSEAFKILTRVGSAETTMLLSQDEPSALRLRFEGEISGSSLWRTKQ